MARRPRRLSSICEGRHTRPCKKIYEIRMFRACGALCFSFEESKPELSVLTCRVCTDPFHTRFILSSPRARNNPRTARGRSGVRVAHAGARLRLAWCARARVPMVRRRTRHGAASARSGRGEALSVSRLHPIASASPLPAVSGADSIRRRHARSQRRTPSTRHNIDGLTRARTSPRTETPTHRRERELRHRSATELSEPQHPP